VAELLWTRIPPIPKKLLIDKLFRHIFERMADREQIPDLLSTAEVEEMFAGVNEIESILHSKNKRMKSRAVIEQELLKPTDKMQNSRILRSQLSTAKVEEMIASINVSTLHSKKKSIKSRAIIEQELLKPTDSELEAQNVQLHRKNRQLEDENAELLLKNRSFETKMSSLIRDAPYRVLANQLRDHVNKLQASLQQQDMYRLPILGSLGRKIKLLSSELLWYKKLARDIRMERDNLGDAVDDLTHDCSQLLLALGRRREVSGRISHAVRMQIGASIRAAHAAMRQDDANSAEGTDADKDEDAASAADEEA